MDDQGALKNLEMHIDIKSQHAIVPSAIAL